MKAEKMHMKKKNSRKLSREILVIFGLSFLISAFSFWILNEASNVILLRYMEEELLDITEHQFIDMQVAILVISFLSGVILFIVLFLILAGERLAYIGEISKGIDALARHEWEYEIPLRGQNELTELAGFINLFSKKEKEFQEMEKQIQEEKIALIRSLSHDIRTPLTSMMSYSEFMKQKDNLTVEEMKTYMNLVEQKSGQIKLLTDRLLDSDKRHTEVIENGRFLMEQLVSEWECELEDDYNLVILLDKCPDFSGEFDVQELRRIFDNLVSNIRKYADESEPVTLKVLEKNGRICIYQSNTCKNNPMTTESRGIGLISIQKIARYFQGMVDISRTENKFTIEISLWEVN